MRGVRALMGLLLVLNKHRATPYCSACCIEQLGVSLWEPPTPAAPPPRARCPHWASDDVLPSAPAQTGASRLTVAMERPVFCFDFVLCLVGLLQGGTGTLSPGPVRERSNWIIQDNHFAVAHKPGTKSCSYDGRPFGGAVMLYKH